MKNILITFGRSFLALEMARHWHAAGHRVFIADSVRYHVSKYSNAVVKTFKVPSPRFHQTEYIQGLLHIVQEEKIDLLIPIYEEISWISKALPRFPSSCHVFSPSFELYQQLQNKWLFQEMLHQLGFAPLKSRLIRTQKDLDHHDFNTPFALKPCYSRASHNVQKIEPGQIPPQIAIDPNNPWIAQEWATGKKFCTYSICRQGNITAQGIYPVHYAINGNSCVTFEAVEHPEIAQWIESLVARLQFTGQIAFDFIETDHKLFAIECNPRATSGLLLFNDSPGIPEAVLGNSHSLLRPETGTRRQIAMGMLLYGWKKNAKPNNNLKDFVSDFFGIKDVVFSSKDPKPFLYEPWIFSYIWTKSRQLELTIPEFFTHDHDWNGQPLS